MKKCYPLAILWICLSALVSGQSVCDYDTEIGINTGPQAGEEPIAVMELPDGNLLGLVTSYYSPSNHFEAVLIKFHPDYRLDTEFGENGYVSHKWSQRNTAESFAIQEDGKILIGGYQAPGNGISQFRPYVARLNADGSPDASFAENGSRKIDISNLTGYVAGIKTLDDGGMKLAIAGYNNQLMLLQLDEEGELDTSFATNGYTIFPYTINFAASAHFLGDGSTIFIASTYINPGNRLSLVKFTAEGLLDEEFGENGVKLVGAEQGIIPYNSLSYEAPFSILSSDEQLLIPAKMASNGSFALLKVDPEDGALVESFGVEGVSVFQEPSGSYMVTSISEHPVSKEIFLAGYVLNVSASMWKMDANGNIMSLCNSEPLYTFPLTFGAQINTHIIHSSGKPKFIGRSGTVDSTDLSTNQSINLMLPAMLNPFGVDNEEVHAHELNIFPNPANDHIYLNRDSNVALQYRIRSILGREVKAGTLYGSVAVSDIPSGLYLISIFSEQQLIGRKKFVKE